MKSKKTHTALALGCCCGLYGAIAHGAGVTGIDVKFVSDSNPARAEFDSDIEETASVLGRVTGNLFATSLRDDDAIRSGLSINASASYEHNIDIDALGESLYRVSLDMFREIRQVKGSPFLRFSLGAGYLDSETQIRDSTLVDVSGSINYQPTQFFDTTFGLQAQVRAAETEVFDTTKTTLFATANFSPLPKLVFRGGLRYVMGDEVSTATPTLTIVNTASVIEPDPAFGGSADNRFAYLLGADSAIAELGLGYSFTASTQANLLYRYVNTEADGDIGYDRNLLELTLSLEL